MSDLAATDAPATEQPVAHTPGPWEVSGGDVWAGITFVAGIPSEFPNATANAHLIAAAPDMLAALWAQHQAIDILLAMVIQLDHSFLPSKSPVWPMLLQGNAAMDKAIGGPQ